MCLAILATCGVLASDGVSAQTGSGQRPSIRELKKLSVEELMALDVTSVSRMEEQLRVAPAAVTIVTAENIRRSGATIVPEALRLVPGLHVARRTSSSWVVAARGFSSVNSEKLLVLSDTRSIYTPLFSGVLWDTQNYLLQDIDRIEVVRGPGATLWGSNAVNGVISINTKSARDTQGLYVETSGGTEERFSVATRYGAAITERAFYRVFGRYFDRTPALRTGGGDADDWQTGLAGFRLDWDVTARDSVTVQGDLYRGDVGLVAPSISVGRPGPEGPLRALVGGGNVLSRWRRKLANSSELQLRAYYDRTHRNDPMFTDDLDTVDIDLQYRRPLPRQELTLGASYRLMAHGNTGKGVFALRPSTATDQLVSGFVQDQIRLTSSLQFTAGTKLEHNDFSGVEVQPSGRISWQPTSSHSTWGAVSRAVRVPTRLERDIWVDTNNPLAAAVVRLVGNREFESEKLLAFEAGYRWAASRVLSIDLAGFRNRYRGLASLEFGERFTEGTRLVIPVQNENQNAGTTNGVEAFVTYSPTAASRISASYSHLRMHLEKAGEDLNGGVQIAAATPRHQFGFRSSFDLPSRFQFDSLLRAVGAVTLRRGTGTERIPSYAELDARLAWLGWRRAEIAIVGRNLLHGSHPEFGVPATRSEVERSVQARFAWGF
jgi:iron complex outermembrane recepter protein